MGRGKIIAICAIWVAIVISILLLYLFREDTCVKEIIAWLLNVWPIPAAIVMGGIALTTWICKHDFTKKEQVPRKNDFIENLRSSKVAWGLWYTGTIPLSERATDHGQLTKILLIDPKSPHFQKILNQCGEDSDLARQKIATLTNRAIGTNRIRIKWYSDYTKRSMTIFDSDPSTQNGELIPDSKKAYIIVCTLKPGGASSDRPLRRINRDKREFNRLLEEYRKIWDNGIEQTKQQDMPKLEIKEDLVISVLESQSHTRLGQQGNRHIFIIPYTLKTKHQSLSIDNVSLEILDQNVTLNAIELPFTLNSQVESCKSTFELFDDVNPWRPLKPNDRFRLTIVALQQKYHSSEFTLPHIGITVHVPTLRM